MECGQRLSEHGFAFCPLSRLGCVTSWMPVDADGKLSSPCFGGVGRTAKPVRNNDVKLTLNICTYKIRYLLTDQFDYTSKLISPTMALLYHLISSCWHNQKCTFHRTQFSVVQSGFRPRLRPLVCGSLSLQHCEVMESANNEKKSGMQVNYLTESE